MTTKIKKSKKIKNSCRPYNPAPSAPIEPSIAAAMPNLATTDLDQVDPVYWGDWILVLVLVFCLLLVALFQVYDGIVGFFGG